MQLISSNDTSTRLQKRRRIHLGMNNPLTESDLQNAIADYIKPYVQEYQIVLVLVYPQRSAQRYGGWIIKALWRGGNRIEISQANNPDLRKWLIEESR